MTEIAYNNNLSFEIDNFGDGLIAYTIIFNESRLGGEPYIFSFGAKYEWDYLKNNASKKVEIIPIEKQEAYVGYEFFYQIKSRGSDITYSDYSKILEVEQSTGIIKFTPSNKHAGNHFVIIKAEDNDGNSDTEIFELSVIEGSNEPYIYYIPDFKVSVGDIFNYNVNGSDPDNDTIFYLDDSNLFDINIATGLINFKAEEYMKGKHLINISLTDTNGLTDTETFELVIE